MRISQWIAPPVPDADAPLPLRELTGELHHRGHPGRYRRQTNQLHEGDCN